ncbi:MAG: ATP-dependent DNA helicase RecG [Candidatus Peregrinibacteria bacterium]
MESFSLSSPLLSALRTTEKYKFLLKSAGVLSIGDFLLFFPRDYEDRSQITHFSQLRGDQKNVLIGTFASVKREYTVRGFSLVKAIFIEESQNAKIECVWFNTKGLEHTIPIGKRAMVVGKAKLSFGKTTLQSPSFERYERDTIQKSIAPVYREVQGIPTEWIQKKMQELLELVEDNRISLPPLLPPHITEEYHLLSRKKAIIELHFPTSSEMLEKAKETMSFEELFLLQLSSLKKKASLQSFSSDTAAAIPFRPEFIKEFFSHLPFTPTNSQKIAIFEILKDLEKPVPMQRLLEGDVGSGKTLVALTAMLATVSAGYQCAIIAPTEILAIQHAEGITRLLEEVHKKGFEYQLGMKNEELRMPRHYEEQSNPENSEQKGKSNWQKEGVALFPKEIPEVSLLTGSVTGNTRKSLLEDLRFGKIDILVGTHAILEDPVVFHHLGLAVVDEQHRFGVLQRKRLLLKGNPHFLQMTATPIPRTLALIAYGDQDLSVLTELPPGRKPIHTSVVPPSDRVTVERFVEIEIEKGRQAFVICPLIEESENLDVKAATEEFIRLEQHIFPHRRIALLHGKMRPAEKEQIMADFKDKKYDILVSTSVVEVGVDVPNATMMMIEGAERFGLSQLHQFRGRVGRGEHASYCFLFPTEKETVRLKAMEKTQNGFELAEMDMRLRGPGSVYGLRQSGLPDLKMASLTDGRKVVETRKAAEEFLQKFPLDDFPELQKELENREEEMVHGG